MSKPNKTPSDSESELRELARRHLRLAWVALSVFVTLGFVLEILHALKLPLYLNVGNETRRLMWTLAHAHGALLAVVNIVFGLTLERRGAPSSGSRVVASRCLLGASVLLPLGFFLGGVVTHAGDPGLGILLVPVGGLLLLTAIFLTARRS